MKTILLIAVLVATVDVSRETVWTRDERNADLSELVQEIQQVVTELSDGSFTSEVIPTVANIVAQAKELECEADDQDDQAQIDAILSRVLDAIKNHEKSGKLATFAVELNRAFFLWTGLADYLVYVNATGDTVLLCESLVAVRASGQTILDKLTNLGETYISFDLEDNLETTSNSGRREEGSLILYGDSNSCTRGQDETSV